jgi:hypothetical protein
MQRPTRTLLLQGRSWGCNGPARLRSQNMSRMVRSRRTHAAELFVPVFSGGYCVQAVVTG